jgi:hypothetical protein
MWLVCFLFFFKRKKKKKEKKIKKIKKRGLYSFSQRRCRSDLYDPLRCSKHAVTKKKKKLYHARHQEDSLSQNSLNDPL